MPDLKREATAQEEAVLHNAESKVQQIKKTARQLLIEATAKRKKDEAQTKAQRRSGGSVAPVFEIKETVNLRFRADELSEMMDVLRHFDAELKRRLRKHPDDVITQQKIEQVTDLIELGNLKHFPNFVKKFREASKDFPEHRVTMLSTSRKSEGEVGAATVRKLESLIKQTIDKQHLPETYRHNRNPLFKPQSDVPLITLSVNTKESNFLADAEKELRVYLAHLKKSKKKAGPQASGDDLLQQKISKVELLLQKTNRRDFSGFEAEWNAASEIIKRHRPKSIGGIKLGFTAVFPFEGKNLVTNIEKARAKINPSNEPKKP